MKTPDRAEVWDLASLALAALGGTWLFASLPYALGHANWVFNVLRNWLDHGYLSLNGQLVCQPGGLIGVAHPLIYTGHRPAFLLPHYVGVLLAQDVQAGLILYNVALNAALVLTTWIAMGRSRRGLVAAAALVTSPGLVRFMIPEPIGSTVHLGLAVIPWLLISARARAYRTASLLAALLCTLCWMQMNWTTLFVLAPFATVLWSSAPAPSRRVTISLAVLLAAAFVPVLLASLGSKMGSSAGEPGAWRSALASYTWGSLGYGNNYPLHWRTAFVRIGGAAAVGLLPLGLVYVWACRLHPAGLCSGLWRTAPPVLVSMALVVAMRNYFAAHPWMSTPPLAVGLLGGLMLLPNEAASSDNRLPCTLGALVAFFTYSRMVLVLFEVQTAGLGEVAALVQLHTPRAAVVIMDNEVAAIPHFSDLEQMAADLDRTFVRQSDTDTADADGRPRYLLARTDQPNLSAPVARSAPTSGPLANALDHVLGFYRRQLGRRRADEYIDFHGPFLLYLLPDERPAP